MSDLKGTNVAAPLVPMTDEDQYPTHDVQYGKGGFKPVGNMAERDAIPAARLSVPTICYVDETNSFHKWNGTEWLDMEIGTTGSGVTRNVRIVNNLDTKNLSASKGDPCYVEFTFISQERYSDADPYEDTGERGSCRISVKAANSDSYEVVRQLWITSGALQKTDVSQYLTSGSNQVMIEVKGEVTGVTTPAFVYTVQLTSLAVYADNFKWWTAFMGTVTLPLQIAGNVSKTLYVSLTGEDYDESYEIPLGTAVYTETAYNYPLPHPGKTGVFRVSVYVANADGSIKTRAVSFNIICATPGDSSKLIAINHPLERAVNWSENILFEYSMYEGDAVYTSATFTVKQGTQSVFSSTEDSVATSTKYTFSLPLEVETLDNSDFSIVAAVSDDSGNLTAPLTFPVNNSLGYSAMPGAVLYITPKTRTNRQSNYRDIINETDGSVITGSWQNMNWGNDGWTEDASGNRVLRLMAGSRLTISHKPFLTECARSGKTLEIDYRVDNVTEYTAPVISLSAPHGDSFAGLNIYADDIIMHSQALKDDSVQSLHTFEGKRTRLALTIVPDAYGYSGFNLCTLYINGRKNRTFTYQNNDYFSHGGNIVIGSENADVDIYGIRQYDSGLSSQGVFNNYVNLLEDNTRKEAERRQNDILDAQGAEISYENCKEKYNTIVYDNTIPSLSDQTERIGNLWVKWIDHPEWNSFITNVTAKGQGTSSMKYWIWNTRYQLDKKLSVVTYGDGSTSTGKWQMTPGQPAGRKYTAKKNFASSMHSHKIGAVNSYTDLVREMALLNEAMTADSKIRVSVWEAPFVCFEKSINDDNEEVHTFRGLYTFGSDKGDADTFRFDTALYPKMLSIEGSDNSPLLTLFRVPWNPDKNLIAYNEAAEAWQYNTANSWGYGAGELSSISTFIPVYNFVYTCSPRLHPFDGTPAQLNAQASTLRTEPTEFWIAKEGDPDQYNVYYYEPAEGKFIPSDIGEGTINLYLQLADKGYGLTASALNGKTHSQQNDLFISARVARFRAEASRYWHIQDTLMFMNNVELNAGTDERAKNTYPYSFGLDTSSWRWRVDDTDTRFDTTNRGLPDKSYSVETHDKDETGASIWNGETNNFFNLMELAFPQEKILNMRKYLTAMQTLSQLKTGNDLEKLYAFYQKYYFDEAQEYFPSVAYNADAKYCYENGKIAYMNGDYSNDTDPITQSLGDHYLAEQRWITRRLVYMMSKYSFGLFSAAGTDTITVRAAGNTIRYELTPAMDLYPAIANGTSIIRGERTKAGGVCVMDVDLSGSGDQQNAIMGASYLQDIGQWHDKNVQASMVIQGRMLREIRLGHKTEPIVITITSLTISNCVSLQKLILSRIATLTGTLNLAACTHLREVYIDGTSLTQLRLPDGGGLRIVEYNALSQYLTLRNYPLMTNEGCMIENCRSSLIDVLIQDCPLMQPMRILLDIMNAQKGQNGHTLRHIRIVGFEEDYYDTTELYGLQSLTDGSYSGLNSSGEAEGEEIPVIDGVMNVHARVDYFKKENLNSLFPKLIINCDEIYKPLTILTFTGMASHGITGGVFSCNVESSYVKKISDTVYEITAPVGSTISYTYTSENYAPKSADIVVQETPSGKYPVSVALTYMPLVTILVQSGGVSLSGASVWVNGILQAQKTDFSGQLQIRSLQALTIKAGGLDMYSVQTTSFAAATDDVTRTVSLTKKTMVTFQVRSNMGTMLSGAEVTCNGETVSSNAEGNAVFYMFAGTYPYTIIYNEKTNTGSTSVGTSDITVISTFELSIEDMQPAENGNIQFIYKPGQKWDSNFDLTLTGPVTIYWGDGTSSYHTTSGKTDHSYPVYDTHYSVEIEGAANVTGMSMNTRDVSVALWSMGDSKVSAIAAFLKQHGVTSILAVGSNLFRNDSDIIECPFIGKGLRKVPKGLFDYFTKVKDFSSAFEDCSALYSVPDDLFENCASGIKFNRTFYGCYSIVTEVPKIWILTGDPDGTNSAISKSYCFSGCTSALNYSDIPLKWRSS